jgi:hypothetical protein
MIFRAILLSLALQTDEIIAKLALKKFVPKKNETLIFRMLQQIILKIIIKNVKSDEIIEILIQREKRQLRNRLFALKGRLFLSENPRKKTRI